MFSAWQHDAPHNLNQEAIYNVEKCTKLNIIVRSLHSFIVK